MGASTNQTLCDPNSSDVEKLTVSSQSAMFLRAAQLVADLHQRASFDTAAFAPRVD
jgi:hypothetical protein